MLVIRDRDELKRHVEHLATMAQSEAMALAASAAPPTSHAYARGRVYAAEQVLAAIQAWEDFDLVALLDQETN
jgi:predicted transcriptional regulator